MTAMNIYVIVVLSINVLLWASVTFLSKTDDGFARVISFLLCIASIIALVAAAQA
jgi:hypothetical protein